MPKSRLVSALEQQVNESHTSEYEVGEQRERNMRYYTLQPLGNEQNGRSHYISPDVLDAVESKKSFFSEIFLSSRQVVKFTESGAGIPFEADQKTAYVNRVFQRNQYERLFRDAWHDAFVAKRCVFLAEWENDTRTVELDIPQPLTEPQLVQLVQSQGDPVSVDTSRLMPVTIPGPMGPQMLVQGKVSIEIDDSYPKISLWQPERFFRDPMASYPDEGMWCTVEDDVPRGTLKDMGYDEDQVDTLSVDYRFRSEEEDAARKRHDSSWTRRRQHNRIPSQEHVTFYKTWTWLESESLADYDVDFEVPEGFALYEVHWAHGEVMKWADSGLHAVSIAEEMPFFEWAEMKISHAEMGTCTSDVVSHTQKVQSILKRLVIDNQSMRNTTRFEAVWGALKNPRDLLDTSIGGVVWSKQLGSVAPMATPELSPLTMQTIALMKQDSEERSGVSGLAKGMNTDAVKYQNADNMIERLTNAGSRRVTMQARDFARTLLVPLSQYIVHLAMRNDTSVDQMEIAGRVIQIAPETWRDEGLEMETAVAITPDEAQSLAQQLILMHNLQSQDPAMAIMYGPEQRHALYDTVYELIGVKDSSRFMLPPESPEYQQAQMAQAQQQQQMQAQQQQAQQFQFGLLQSADQREWQKAQSEMVDKMADNTREDEKFDWQRYVEERELDIEDEQDRPVRTGN